MFRRIRSRVCHDVAPSHCSFCLGASSSGKLPLMTSTDPNSSASLQPDPKSQSKRDLGQHRKECTACDARIRCEQRPYWIPLDELCEAGARYYRTWWECCRNEGTDYPTRGVDAARIEIELLEKINELLKVQIESYAEHVEGLKDEIASYAKHVEGLKIQIASHERTADLQTQLIACLQGQIDDDKPRIERLYDLLEQAKLIIDADQKHLVKVGEILKEQGVSIDIDFDAIAKRKTRLNEPS